MGSSADENWRGVARRVTNGGSPRRTLVRVVAAALFAASCSSASSSSASSSSASSSSPSTSPRTASDAVTAYYTALGRHDKSTAEQLLAPEVRALYESTADSDFTNVAHLTNMRDVKEGVVPLPGGIPPGYQDVTQVALQYDVVYNRVVTEHSGTSTRFVYVGRTGSAAPWRILTIGSGP
jgi:hypothetical protein